MTSLRSSSLCLPQHLLPPYNTHPFSFPSGFQPVSPAKWGVGRTSLRMPVHTSSSMPPPPPRPLLTNARDTLHRYLPHTLLEAAEPGVDLSDLGLFALNQLLDDLRKEGSEGPTPAPATTLPGPLSEPAPLSPGASPPKSPGGSTGTKTLAPPHTCTDTWYTSTHVLIPTHTFHKKLHG